MGMGCELKHECVNDRRMKAISDQEQLKLQAEKRKKACPG
jgi:hypothetical protein